MHPFQSLMLIPQAIVQTSTLLHFSTSQESIRPDSVVKVNHNHVHTRGLYKTDTAVIRIGKLLKPSALNPEKNRKFSRAVESVCWGEDVQEETVFRRSCRRSNVLISLPFRYTDRAVLDRQLSVNG